MPRNDPADGLPTGPLIRLDPDSGGRADTDRGRRRRMAVRLGFVRSVADVLALTAAAISVSLPLRESVVAILLGAAFLRSLGHGELRPRVVPHIRGMVARLGGAGLLIAPFLDNADRGQLLLLGVIAFPLVAFGRGLAYWVVRRLRAAGIGLRRALVLGAGEVSRDLATVLHRHPQFGLDIVGMVASDGAERDPPVIADANRVVEATSSADADAVVVTFAEMPDQQFIEHLRELKARNVDVYVVPRFFELGESGADRSVDRIWGYRIVRLREAPHLRRSWRLKRALDVVGSATLLVLLAPLMALIALAVRLSGPGPILYRSIRLGAGGEPFEILKFRTLHPGDDDADPDERATAAGRVLRPTHLDELPQLVNILRGDMSLVGPRPHDVEEFDSNEIPRYAARHRVKPGITGLAQVEGFWGDTPIEHKVRFDNRYIEDWSFREDLGVLLRTPRSAFGHQYDNGDDGADGDRAEEEADHDR